MTGLRRSPTYQSLVPKQGGELPSPRPMPLQMVLLLHAGYWGMYTLLLALLFNIVRSANTPRTPLSAFFTSGLAFLVYAPAFVAFYVQYAWLVPRLLARKRFGALTLGSLLVAFCCSAIAATVVIFATSAGRQLRTDAYGSVGAVATFAVLALIHMIIATVMRGFIGWYDDIALKQELTRKTEEVETALLRAKLDPHFLFNTLNNIDVLIARDGAAASEYLNKLSDILRFVLYDARGNRVTLSAEIQYFEKYVALQRIRIANPGFVDMRLEGSADGLLIAPMILIPFVENAFKHAAGQRGDRSIEIELRIHDALLTFNCVNRYQRGTLDLAHAGGIGRELMERRLRLLYPQKHTLSIADDDSRYAVHLTINLDDHALHHR